MTRYYIYMLSNTSRMLYVGLTTDLEKIIEKHRDQRMASFKGNFSFNKLVYVEETTDIHFAVRREIELKNSSRFEKMNLLNMLNPDYNCLLEQWTGVQPQV